MEQKQPEQIAYQFLLAFREKWEGKGIGVGTEADEEAILWTGKQFVKKSKSGPAKTICKMKIPARITGSLDDRRDKSEARVRREALGTVAKECWFDRKGASFDPEKNKKLLSFYIEQLPVPFGQVWRDYQLWHNNQCSFGERRGEYWVLAPLERGDRDIVYEKMETHIRKGKFYEITCALQQLLDLIILDRITTFQFFKRNSEISMKEGQSFSMRGFESAIDNCPGQMIESLQSMLEICSVVSELEIYEFHKMIDAKGCSKSKEMKCLSMLKKQMDSRYISEKCSIRQSIRRMLDALRFPKV
jgi:hypothetical protein